MSLQSTSEVTSEEQEQDQLEDLIYELMGRSGLLSELKSRIAQFIQTNGKIKDKNYSVNFSRVNPNILSLIYEYLKWVGMTNTCALLLSESPVPISTTTTKSDGETVTDGNSVPQLCTYLSGLLNQTDSQSSFILNETFTKGESNSIPFTSTPNNNSINNTKAQKQEQQKSNGKESNNSLNGSSMTTTNLNQTYVTKINTHQDSVHTTTVNNMKSSNTSSTSAAAEESNVKHGEDDKSEGAGDSFSYNNNSSSSSSKKQESNKETSGLKSLNSDQFNGKGDDDDDNAIQQSIKVLEKGDGGWESLKEKEEKMENTSTSLFKSNTTKRETENLLDISNPLAHKSEMSEPDFDESISDLLDGKSEDETLDVSIDSDGKGMSSCEHFINLK